MLTITFAFVIFPAANAHTSRTSYTPCNSPASCSRNLGYLVNRAPFEAFPRVLPSQQRGFAALATP
jgi:hypothetical protein